MSNLKNLKKEIVTNLETIRDTLKGHYDSRPGSFTEIWGYEAVPATADDLRYLAIVLKDIINSINFDKYSKIDKNDTEGLVYQLLSDIREQLTLVRAIHLPQLFASVNVHKNILDVFQLIQNFIIQIQHELGFPDLLTINAQARRRWDKLSETIDTIESESNSINEKLKAITNAYSIAEDLPSTTKDLNKAKSLVDETLNSIQQIEQAAQKTLEEAKQKQLKIDLMWKETGKIMDAFSKKYAAFTSVGLASSFSQRAIERKNSVKKWTVLLVLSLLACGWIGYERFPSLLETLKGSSDFSNMFVNMLYGFLSMSPAIWLAWISSIQIGMNYRISEDYNYKSSLASSYEGFRTEALRIDPYLESKLFMITLNRLDEIPLRFVDQKVEASPLNDLINSKEFQNAVDNSEELKLRAITVIKGLKEVPKDMADYLDSLIKK